MTAKPELAEAADAALAAVDKVIADKPHKVGHDFSESVRRLSRLRDGLIARFRTSRSPSEGERLRRLNGVISVMVGGQYPVGEIKWKTVEQARDSLREIVREFHAA